MSLLAADSTTFGGVHDFFNSHTWYTIRNVGAAFVVVFWLGVAFWVFKDARRRIRSPWLVALATLLGLFPPFLGAFVYMLFRPPEYLEDVRERELEIKAMEERLSRRDMHCPVCRADVDQAFLVCPVCTTRLRQSCTNCKAPLEALWQVCPYCETPVQPAAVDLGETQALAPPRRERSA
ncbi:MAG: zinc ribbon domain-containing protein [Gaiellaceae bacterium]